MSEKDRMFAKVSRSVLLFALALWPANGVLALDGWEDLSADAVSVPLNSSLRGYGDTANGFYVFELDITKAGILSVDIAVPGPARVEPKIEFLGQMAPSGRKEFALIERTADHLVLWVQSPGTYLFGVAAQDPLLPLQEYRLITGFAAGDVAKDGEEEDDEEIVIEPNPLMGGGIPNKDGEDDDGEIVIEPNPLTGSGIPNGAVEDDDGEIVMEPNPLTGGGKSGQVLVDGLCRSGEVDDHGDTFTCATSLSPGEKVAGEIGNAWGDDLDFLVFEVVGMETVFIESSGETDTFGGLYDRFGQRLKMDDDGGEGDNFRLIKSLAPGLYFLRVEGRDGAEGPYVISLELSDR